MKALSSKTVNESNRNADIGFFPPANNYAGTPVARSQAGNSRAPEKPASHGVQGAGGQGSENSIGGGAPGTTRRPVRGY